MFWHLAADAGGRIVGVGSYCVRMSSGALDYYVLAARYTADGQLDPTFANGNAYRQDWLGDDHQMKGVAIHPDGRILIAGWRGTADYNTMSLVVWRLLDNGDLDSSFGMNGMMTTNAMAGGNGTVAGPVFVRGGTAFAIGGRAYVKVGQKGKNPIMSNVFAAGRFLYQSLRLPHSCRAALSEPGQTRAVPRVSVPGQRRTNGQRVMPGVAAGRPTSLSGA